MRHCLLDMDGVTTDFVAGACAVHNRPVSSVQMYGFHQAWGITEQQLWAPLQSVDFWANLPKTPEADELVDLACRTFGADQVAFLTCPYLYPSNALSSACVQGKQEWVRRHYPALQHQILYTTVQAKRFLAGPGRVLIDDRSETIEDFCNAGGWGILFARPWNKLSHEPDPMLFVRARLRLGEKLGRI